MTERRPDFELNTQSAEKIASMLDFDFDTLTPQSTPSEICKELRIDRRTFNSVISKAIFSRQPTEAQKLLRHQIMDNLFTEFIFQEEKEHTP